MDPLPYFAYGSNLLLRRLRDRAPSARALGRARLPSFAWRCDKRGADGSAKANLAAVAGAETWGVLFALAADDWPALDRAERGYARIRVRVLRDGGAATSAWTYVSTRLAPTLQPAPWYLDLILAGAREHDLPAAWIARLAAAAAAVTHPPRSARGTGR